MSQLIYNSVRLNILQTDYLEFIPERTEDGADQPSLRFEFAGRCVFNPSATASNGPGVQAGAGILNQFPFAEDAPLPGVTGDPLGTSIALLKQMLHQDRQTLTYSVGGNLVFTSPPAGAATDARNGPLVRACKVMKVFGTQSAIVYFHVVTWLQDYVSGGPKGNARRVVLANRFTVAASMDREYWTTRYVRGQMIVDAGQLAAQANILTPDAFRQAAFLQQPQGFKRDDVQVTVASDNTTLDYSYTDTETRLALGPRSLATYVEGNVTAGMESPLRNVRAVAKAAKNAVNAAMQLGAAVVDPFGLVGPGIGGAFGANDEAWASIVPELKANGIVRIWGMRNADRSQLMLLGNNILLDRFSPQGGGLFVRDGNTPRFISFYCTQDLAERFVEVRGELFTPLITAVGAILNNPPVVINRMMAFGSNIVSKQAANTADPLLGDGTGFSPPPPNGQGTRGNWLGALVTALLGQPGQLPQNPQDPPPQVIDQANFI